MLVILCLQRLCLYLSKNFWTIILFFSLHAFARHECASLSWFTRLMPQAGAQLQLPACRNASPSDASLLMCDVGLSNNGVAVSSRVVSRPGPTQCAVLLLCLAASVPITALWASSHQAGVGSCDSGPSCIQSLACPACREDELYLQRQLKPCF